MLLASIKEEIIELLSRVEMINKEVYLKMNITRTKKVLLIKH